MQRILEALDRLIISSRRLTLSLLSSHAITFPLPLMRAARWTVLFPGAEQASRTFTNKCIDYRVSINPDSLTPINPEASAREFLTTFREIIWYSLVRVSDWRKHWLWSYILTQKTGRIGRIGLDQVFNTKGSALPTPAKSTYALYSAGRRKMICKVRVSQDKLAVNVILKWYHFNMLGMNHLKDAGMRCTSPSICLVWYGR